jgi:hypothetical protein
MKFRHGAAILPMIWYLLIPPSGGNEHTPLHQWQMVNEFETESECQSGRQKYHDDGAELMKLGKTTVTIEESRRFTNAMCAEADDPRLQSR